MPTVRTFDHPRDLFLSAWQRLPPIERLLMRIVKIKVFYYLETSFSCAQPPQTPKNAINWSGVGKTPRDRRRVERDWSLKDLAAATKLSVSQIGSSERGANLRSVESRLNICRAFDKKPSEVFAAIEF